MVQDYTVCFQIIEELVNKELSNGCALCAWGKLNKKFQTMISASKTILWNKFTKCELDDVTRDPEYWITELELLREDLRKLGVIIDGAEIMTHILSNLTEGYKNIFENLED